MKILKKISVISLLLVILIYVTNISAIPNNLVVFQGEEIKLNTILGIKIKNKEEKNENLEKINEQYETVLTSSAIESSTNKIGKLDLTLNLFGKIPLKDITVNVIPRTSVVPLGNAVGLKLYTSGVLVVGMSEIEGGDNKKYKPYENSGIEEGDMIVSIDDTTVTCTADLVETVNQSNGKQIRIKYIREGEDCQTSITPVKGSDNKYKLGLWVRDAAAGVGTVSFYDPTTKTFAALGHGILDVDTEQLINIANGDFITTKILSITKGKKGNPGKISGTIENQTTIGQVSKNTEFGVYGKLKNLSALNIDISKAMEVATRDEIETGPAKIMCTLENNNTKEYDVEIQKIYKNNNENNKSMLVKVTDPELIEKTGGIIQGMSGSPIIQDNKIVGALTHVLVNDPEMGYGVFADLMIKQMKEVE